MYYYRFQVRYNGPKGGIPNDSFRATVVEGYCYLAERWAAEIAHRCEYLFDHEYSWPDGSVYKLLACDQPLETVKEAIQAVFESLADDTRFNLVDFNLRGVEPTKKNHTDMTYEARFRRHGGPPESQMEDIYRLVDEIETYKKAADIYRSDHDRYERQRTTAHALSMKGLDRQAVADEMGLTESNIAWLFGNAKATHP